MEIVKSLFETKKISKSEQNKKQEKQNREAVRKKSHRRRLLFFTDGDYFKLRTSKNSDKS